MKKKAKLLEVPSEVLEQTQAQIEENSIMLKYHTELLKLWQNSTGKNIPSSMIEMYLWLLEELKQLQIKVNNRNSSDFCVFIPVLLNKDVEIKILLGNTGQVTSEVLVKGEVTKEVKLKDHTDLPILAQMANLESTKIQLQKPGYRG